ncbi:MAG TPA: protease pro-enzyme activation domain-containing protein, partial [Bryobacteraceae bacterium]|nr:protease pro-enzyme activation domain-containing protein [Bryobacteraceae bacterium]
MKSCNLLGALCLFAVIAAAQPARLNRPIDNNRRIMLAGQVHPRALAETDQGMVDPGLLIRNITITFEPTAAQQAELDQLLTEQQTPGAPNYHRWLIPEEYAQRFGLNDSDLAKVNEWLESQGLTIASVARSRAWIAVSGTAARIQTAFRTELHHYLADGELRFANATVPSVPEALGAVVRGIRGLNNFKMQPRRLAQRRSLDPNFTSGGSHYLSPDDLATIYNINSLYGAGIDGTGQKIVIAGQTQIDLADIRRFRTTFNLPANDPQVILVPGLKDPGVSTDDVPEAHLDIEWAGAVARNAAILYVYSDDVMDAVQYAIDQNLAPVVSTSYGLCELEYPRAEALSLRTSARQAIAQGITWFSASGDSGAADCGDTSHPGLAVDVPASIPEVTAVGGTQFNEGSGNYWNTTNDANRASARSYIPETAWNDSVINGEPSSTGGGLSTYFAQPAWQNNLGFTDAARHLPDVSMTASANHVGYLVYTGGKQEVFGGTSVPTPVMAGVAALMNHLLVARGVQANPGMGNMNPGFYAFAKNSPDIFHDITEGNNIVTVACPRRCTPTPVGYNAGPGYDNVTGLGSFDVFKLAMAWAGVSSSGTTNISLLSNVRSLSATDMTYLTATVSGASGSTPSGSVTFTAGSTPLGSAALVGSAGTATATLAVRGSQLPVGSATITATYNPSGSSSSATATVTVSVSSTTTGTGSMPSIAGFGNGASFRQTFAPGMILSVFGTQFAPSTQSASAVPLPYSMKGVAVTVNGVAAPLYYVSPSQINLQIPYETAVGNALVAINNNGQVSTQNISLSAVAPGIFTDVSGAQVPYTTASRGKFISMYVTGAGLVSPEVSTGAAPATTTAVANLPRPSQETRVT